MGSEPQSAQRTQRTIKLCELRVLCGFFFSYQSLNSMKRLEFPGPESSINQSPPRRHTHASGGFRKRWLGVGFWRFGRIGFYPFKNVVLFIVLRRNINLIGFIKVMALYDSKYSGQDTVLITSRRSC